MAESVYKVYSDDKLRDSVLYILNNPKTKDISIMFLAKLVYLSDYTYARTFGNQKPITGKHKRFEYGPVPSGFYMVLDQLYEQGYAKRDQNVISGLKPGKFSLSEEERACIDKVIDDYAGGTLSRVKSAAYVTEPMVEIQKLEAITNSGKLHGFDIVFDDVPVHPLLDAEGLDISFMDDEEFKAQQLDG